MYFLDFHGLYKHTTLDQRREVRRSLNRDEVMTRKLKQQRNKCFYCATPITMADHLDHVIPVYYGGTNRLSNLVASCKPCNMAKMTDQIEITNEYTIREYLKLQQAYKEWKDKINGAPPAKRKWIRRRQPKRVRLYNLYHAKLFRKVRVGVRLIY